MVAEAHYDPSRNMVAVLGGERRYVLAHPDQCHKMALFPPHHPSRRHSAADWANNTSWEQSGFDGDALVNEVVLQAGDVLYLPTHWFHFIISLTTSYQCNTRSGSDGRYGHHIAAC